MKEALLILLGLVLLGFILVFPAYTSLQTNLGFDHGWITIQEHPSIMQDDDIPNLCVAALTRDYLGFPFAYLHLGCNETAVNPLFLAFNLALGGLALESVRRLANRLFKTTH